MQSIKLNNVTANLGTNERESFLVSNLTWQVESAQHWVLLGGNGAGKSAITAVLLDQANIVSGTRSCDFKRTEIVSSDLQKQLITAELLADQDDITDGKTSPKLVSELIYQQSCPYFDQQLCQQLITGFAFEALLKQRLRALSTGETRKLMLIKALSNRPELIVLDEPFDGLDVQSVELLRSVLIELSASMTMVFVVNRLDEIPVFITHYGYVKNGELQQQLATPDLKQRDDLFKLLHLQQTDLTIPSKDVAHSAPEFSEPELVRLQNASVSYSGKVIFNHLNWTIKARQHWQLSGQNGSGKTCLLNLITGDNPQCYNNDIKVFGYQRGSGESIWQIKQHIGYISNALHMEYRVSISALNTIVSGFYDSIGLYQKPTQIQLDIAIQWLALLGLSELKNTPFTQLSFGDQRMLLIARAMVKHPTLLILDEPCLGLDEANRQRVLLLIEKICTAGSSTVIYVNHHAKDKITGIEHYLDMADFR
ncbi:MAG: molybdate transport system ATP-binding protein [Pseudoalteromonas rhizosphaerae]|uniref:ATP-binding cassette domain-containing protein n=2 Tax=Pseudoalteromonas TaxID=53246 RepID=A0ABY3FDQ5_9GAMM|nr:MULTISPECIES: ATP-binding cassette domain-containing protein [Pseudoalteromonas]MBB1507683.1 ATP-binding cassette domain-containing protein [Pseudoalteromonas sp. SG41-1]TVU82814.1 ATP-binding cassette domain-containing protein [Pseudoalteromonas neustonica]